MMEPRHRHIAEIALSAGGRYSLALAGGYAVRAHGMGSRPSGDVDLFLDWGHRGEFPEALEAVTAALREKGYTVELVMRAETFARLLIAEKPDAEPDKLEISADWRAHPPVTLDIGPVLHPDDAVANKMIALYGRALARDFLDIDAAITSGRYTRERLLDLAGTADLGFDQALFATALGALTQITDTAFDEYSVPADELAPMRRRFATWRSELLAS
jgi:hypothetical protein